MSKITYTNKVALNENADIPNVNKVTDDDMNEIKTVVNNNDDELTTINTNLTNATTYSTDEIRVGTWINNKPIYRKVLTGTLPIGSGENVFTISNANIINFNGMVKSTYDQWWPIPSIYSEDNYRIYTYISLDRTQLKVYCGSYFSTNSQYEIIIEYTKTTDV